LYTGSPQLEQLNEDLRAAELGREAPRLSVPEDQYNLLIGGAQHEDGKRYEVVDTRQLHSATSGEATLFDRSLGTFRLESGGLAFFALQSASQYITEKSSR